VISIDIEMRGSSIIESLLVSEKQMRYAVASSINATMKIIQQRQRQQVRKDLTVRKAKFIDRQIAIIKPFARSRVGNLWAMISIGRKPRLQLSGFQEGGVQEPTLGRNIAVPVTGGARPTKLQSVPRQFFITRMGLHRVVSNVRGKTSVGGVFVIRDRGIFLRQGDEIKILYAFLTSERIERRLHFYEVAARTTAEVFPPMLRESVVESMNHTLKHGAMAIVQAALAGTVAAMTLSRFGVSSGEPEDERDDTQSFDE
jgi:hypothetical protein